MHWKFLRAGATSPFSGLAWSPDTWVDGHIYACRRADLPYWLCDELWVIEFDGRPKALHRKVVGTRARLVEPVAGWDAAARADLARACLARAIRYATQELRTMNLPEQADRLATAGDVAAAARSVRSQLSERTLREAQHVLTYLEDAAAGLDEYPVASIAYITARLADTLSEPLDPDPYRTERAWQADWLARRLELNAPSTG